MCLISMQCAQINHFHISRTKKYEIFHRNKNLSRSCDFVLVRNETIFLFDSRPAGQLECKSVLFIVIDDSLSLWRVARGRHFPFRAIQLSYKTTRNAKEKYLNVTVINLIETVINFIVSYDLFIGLWHFT